MAENKLNEIHLLAVIAEANIPAARIPAAIRPPLAAIKQWWNGKTPEQQSRIWMLVLRNAMAAQDRPDPCPDEDLSDVEDEF
jgi:hypothetical protein